MSVALPSSAPLMRCLLALLSLGLAHAYSGEGTAYGNAGGRGVGACGMGQNLGIYETYYASLNEHQYSGSHCGKCIRVSGAAGSAVLMVVDKCMGCSHGDVDMSSNALKKVTGFSWDRKPIQWSFVSCSGGGDSSSTRKASRKPSRKPSRSRRNKPSRSRKTKPSRSRKTKPSRKCRKGRAGRKCRAALRGRRMMEAGEQ